MNHILTLEDLPTAPQGKTGWPWTEQNIPLPEQMSDGSEWPRISIVTPSYNQGQFIEETIRSVLLQGYPNLEYIIIDGGSTDKSLDIIKKYEPWLNYWVSEPDKGQSHAINKGVAKTTGEILGWLNSDDYYHAGALETVVRLKQKHPDGIAWVGSCEEISCEGTLWGIFLPKIGTKEEIGDWGVSAFYQPACLFLKDLFVQVGGLDERLEYVMDIDLWIRLVEHGKFISTNDIIASARTYPEAKTYRDPLMKEAEIIAININRGNSQVAKRRFMRYLENMSYKKLLLYLVKRTVSKAFITPFKRLKI